jgi:hypothetical protein
MVVSAILLNGLALPLWMASAEGKGVLDNGAPCIVGDAEFTRDGVRLMVTWAEEGQQRSAIYWIKRGEMQQLAEQAGRPEAALASSEYHFRLIEPQVGQRVLDKHAQKQSALGASGSHKS